MFTFSFLVTVTSWILMGTSTSGDIAKSREDICICTLEYRPFCASDLNTYSNYCELQCAILHNPGLHAICSGPCPCRLSDDEQSLEDSPQASFDSFKLQQQTEKEHYNNTEGNPDGNNKLDCMCPKMLMPVCGSNGVKNTTYANECLLRCDQQQGNNTGMVKIGDGECQG